MAKGMGRKEYIRMLTSKKKKATRRDEFREFETVSFGGGEEEGFVLEGFVNIATRKRFVTKLKFFTPL